MQSILYVLAWFPGWLQRSCLIPTVVQAAQFLLEAKGADALNASLNVLGLLFLLELDDMLFKVLPESIRMHIEEAGTIQVGRYEDRIFNAAKLTYIPVVTLACTLPSCMRRELRGNPEGFAFAITLTPVVLMVIPRVLADTVERAGSGKKGLKWAIVRLICMPFKCLASILGALTIIIVISGYINPDVIDSEDAAVMAWSNIQR